MPCCWNENSYAEKAIERTGFEKKKLVWNTMGFQFETRSDVYSGPLEGPDCIGGCKQIWETLKMHGFGVPRSTVESLLRELDPKGTRDRMAHFFGRRAYRNNGPNDT